jgi:hypothetical protein
VCPAAQAACSRVASTSAHVYVFFVEYYLIIGMLAMQASELQALMHRLPKYLTARLLVSPPPSSPPCVHVRKLFKQRR